jgi:hypothetical protein
MPLSPAGVSNEFSTVSNALRWFYLAAKWAEVSVEKRASAACRLMRDRLII